MTLTNEEVEDDEIPSFELGGDARLRNEPFDPLQSTDWQTGWKDADRDVRALEALSRGEPCPICAVGERCVICSET